MIRVLKAAAAAAVAVVVVKASTMAAAAVTETADADRRTGKSHIGKSVHRHHQDRRIE